MRNTRGCSGKASDFSSNEKSSAFFIESSVFAKTMRLVFKLTFPSVEASPAIAMSTGKKNTLPSKAGACISKEVIFVAEESCCSSSGVRKHQSGY